jgi:hypothetical protein
MNLVKQSELAEIAKVKRQAISYAVKHDKLRTYSDTNKINLDDPLTVTYLKNDSGNRQKAQAKSKKERGVKPRRKSKIKITGPEDTPDYEISSDNPDERVQKLYWDIRKTKEAALKIEIERDKARGRLINRYLVQRVFAKLYTVDTNELLPLKDRLSSEIAAMIGVDDPELILKINKRIEKELYKALKHIKRLMDDFLESIKHE